MNILPKYLTRTQAAALLDRCPKTLRNLQNKGLGPAVIMIGNRPAYPIAELEAWLASNTVGGC